jgi:hypothetical protein
MKLKIKNTGLTGYYLEQKLSSDLDKSGLKVISDEKGEKPDKIELHYTDEKDLEKKISLILGILTDK